MAKLARRQFLMELASTEDEEVHYVHRDEMHLPLDHLFLDSQCAADMRYPKVITVTVEIGDKLND